MTIPRGSSGSYGGRRVTDGAGGCTCCCGYWAGSWMESGGDDESVIFSVCCGPCRGCSGGSGQGWLVNGSYVGLTGLGATVVGSFVVTGCVYGSLRFWTG